jgi:hypothetical protein
LEKNKISVKVEMRTRLRLAEILLNETENLDMADDLLSKGVSLPSLTTLILDFEDAKGFLRM